MGRRGGEGFVTCFLSLASLSLPNPNPTQDNLLTNASNIITIVLATNCDLAQASVITLSGLNSTQVLLLLYSRYRSWEVFEP